MDYFAYIDTILLSALECLSRFHDHSYMRRYINDRIQTAAILRDNNRVSSITCDDIKRNFILVKFMHELLEK